MAGGPDGPPGPPATWWTPDGETVGVPRYLEALRAGRWIVVAALVVCIAFAALYLVQAQRVYQATADVLVNPISNLLVPVPGIIQQSNDPTRDVETAARLVTSPVVARRVIDRLRLPTDVTGVLRQISADPVAQSNIVTVTAESSSAAGAKALADAVAQEFVAYRTERLHQTLDGYIARLRPQVRSAVGDQSDPASPRNQLTFLEGLRSEDDPSIRVESLAETPSSPSSPRPTLTIAAAVLGGLVLGLLGAFGLQLLDPRLRREEQLRAQFRLPILARIPLEKRRAKRPLLPSELSLGALDGFQALRAALTTSRRDSLAGRVVLVTGSSPGDGKTTAAINLASTLAAAGKRVILIEADSRRPSVGRALDMRAEVGLASVVTGRRYLVDALMPVGGEDSKLRVLLNSPDEAPAADVLSHLSADTLLLQAQRLADWVIVDSPPLNHVAETLALAQAVDDVLVVVRVGRTNRRDLTELAEMLAQQAITPAGFLVVGGHARAGYY
ncbi:MAG: AAA family ATPase [Solirubrobacteraceae bacterium]